MGPRHHRDRAVDVRHSTTNARVVDENVQVAFAFVDHTHGGLDGRVDGHVELHEKCAKFVSGCLAARYITRTDVNSMPLLDQLASGLLAVLCWLRL